MAKTTLVIIAISLGIGANVALAEGGPDLGRPFVDLGVRHSPMATGGTGGPVLSETDARARLQADGYRAITHLVQGNDNAWRGTAIRGAAKLNVAVDPQGRIFAQ
jgi:hypothetical protein